MSRERRLRELLEAAVDLPAAERRPALAARCDDAALVDEALALLAGEADLGRFLETPGAGALGPTLAEAGSAGPTAPAPSIPGVTLEGVLGEGGMGRVYLGRQHEPVARRVAVKMIRASLHDPRTAHRFAAEQAALARLNHPSIAQLYEAGTTGDGRPYVVMEYVEGVPITEYCDREGLRIGDRLRLFCAVCRGVEHAHRRQLLHRDLKPSNLLVTRDEGGPVPKIIDFGIARALDGPGADLDLTGLRLIGTPHYMSPEALAPGDGEDPRDLDTRTDVYSLGVVLFELLTGARPFAGRTGELANLLRSVGQDPPRPSARLQGRDASTRRQVAAARGLEPEALVRRLRGDLDAVALKALARNREERYGSAAALADDLERTLRHEPVTARAPGLPERLAKLARRHRLAASLAALTLASLATAAVLSSFALVRATRAEEAALREAAATRQVADFLVELFDAARPGRTQGREVAVQELVARGAERIAAQELPPLQRARLLHTLADVQMRLGEHESGRRLAAEALEIRQRHHDEAHPEVLESLDLLGALERRTDHLEEAEIHLERLLHLAGREGTPGYDPWVHADAMNSLANLRWRQERLEEAEDLYLRTLALRRRLADAGGPGTPDPDRDPTLDVAASLNNLGVLYWSQDRNEEAEPYLRQAEELAEAERGEDHPLVATALGNRAIVLQNLGRLEESEALQRRSLEIRQRILGPDHPSVADNIHNLGVLLSRQGRLDEAEAAYRRALDLRRPTLGAAHPETLKTATNLARVVLRRGRPGEARRMLEDVLATRIGALGPEHPEVGRTLYDLGQLEIQAGGDAEGLLRRALAIQQDREPPRSLERADTLHALGELGAARGDREGALVLLREALELRRAGRPADHPEVLESQRAVEGLVEVLAEARDDPPELAGTG